VKPKQPTLIRFLIDNLGWLLGSLLLALVIWYTAVSAQNPVVEDRFPERIPIESKIDPGLIVVNNPPTSAQVTVRALRSTWNELEPENLSVAVNLAGYGPGTYTVDLKGALTGVRGGTIVDVQPRRITVELAKREEKKVTVAVQISREPPVGYAVVATTPTETTATVSGPEASVSQVQVAQARISLQGQSETFSRDVTLIPIDADGKTVENVTLAPTSVSVTVEIQQRADVTALVVDPTITGNPAEGYFRSGYRWEPRRIFVRGDQTAIERLNGVVRTEPIDQTDRTQTFTQGVKVALPTGVEMVNPTDITVTVEINPIESQREFIGIPVQPQGLDRADYNITITPERVNVIVTGPKLLVDQLTSGDVSVFAPLVGLAAGTHTVTLQASVTKAEVTAVSVSIPNNPVEVTIIARNPTVTPTPGPTRTPTPLTSPTPEATPTP
jgi:YbbR domain-containing protein